MSRRPRKEIVPPVDANWPTPDEIAARAASIRRDWSPAQLRTRAGIAPDTNSVEIPVTSFGALDGRGSLAIDHD